MAAPNELDDKVANLHPPALGAALNVPTQEQAHYTGVKVQGSVKGGHYRCRMTVHSTPSSLRNKQFLGVEVEGPFKGGHYGH